MITSPHQPSVSVKTFWSRSQTSNNFQCIFQCKQQSFHFLLIFYYFLISVYLGFNNAGKLAQSSESPRSPFFLVWLSEFITESPTKTRAIIWADDLEVVDSDSCVWFWVPTECQKVGSCRIWRSRLRAKYRELAIATNKAKCWYVT